MKEKELILSRISINTVGIDKSTDEEISFSNDDSITGREIIERKKEIKKKDDSTEEGDLNPIYKKQIISELTKDKTIVNVDKLIYLFIAYLLLLIITLAKGSEHVSSIIGLER